MADCHAWKRNIRAAVLLEEAAVVMAPCGTMAPCNLGGCVGIIRREDVRPPVLLLAVTGVFNF